MAFEKLDIECTFALCACLLLLGFGADVQAHAMSWHRDLALGARPIQGRGTAQVGFKMHCKERELALRAGLRLLALGANVVAQVMGRHGNVAFWTCAIDLPVYRGISDAGTRLGVRLIRRRLGKMPVTWLGGTTRPALIGVLREVVAGEELIALCAGHQVTALHRRHLRQAEPIRWRLDSGLDKAIRVAEPLIS